MGTLIYFPSERYGAVTRSTEQPHAVERLAGWLRKVAHIRASASLGCEVTIELAPNVVPIRRPSKLDAIADAVRDHCRMKRLPAYVIGDAIRCGFLRARHGASIGAAIQSAKIRAEFVAEFRKPNNGPEAAR